MQSVIHLDDQMIAALLGDREVGADAKRAVWAAFRAWGRGEAATTQRVRAVGANGIGMTSAMAAVVPPYCGGKLYATSAGRFTFVNVLFHVDGTLLATLDGDAITAHRTPAASSLAIHHLASPGATVATIVGTGRQAWPHIRMLATAIPGLAELRVCGRLGSPAARLLAERARVEYGLPTVAHDDANEAIAGAHVIVTVTNSSEPLFAAAAVGNDALICAVGATKHDRIEIGPDVIERCGVVVCDDVAGSKAECGDLVNAAAQGSFNWSDAIELSAVAARTVTVLRAGDAPVLFETQGVAIQDVVLCGLAYERLVADAESTSATATDLGGEPRGEPTPCDSAFVSSVEPAEQAKRELDAASGWTDPLKTEGANS